MNLRKDHCRNLREQKDPRTRLQNNGGAASAPCRLRGPEVRARPGANTTPARIAPRTTNIGAPLPAGPPARAAASRRFYLTKRLSATDISALASMKNVAKCDTWCELQNPVNHRVFERKLRPKPSWPGHVCLGVTHRVAPTPSGGIGAETGPPCAPARGRPKRRPRGRETPRRLVE